MKPKVLLNFWMCLMLPLASSGATYTHIENLPGNDSFTSEENEFSRTKRMATGTVLLIANLITMIPALGFCVVDGVENAWESYSSCYYYSEACDLQKEIKTKNEEILKVLKELETLDSEVRVLKEDYDASVIYYNSWTESLDFISDVLKEVQKIGNNLMGLWSIKSDTASDRDKAAESYQEGLNELLSGSNMGKVITSSAFSGVALLSGTMAFAFSKWATARTAAIGEKLVLAVYGTKLQDITIRITKLARNAFLSLGIVINVATTGMCAYGLISSRSEAHKKLEIMRTYRNDLKGVLTTLESVKDQFKDVRSKYTKGIQKITKNSNLVLDTWSNYCPDLDINLATEKEKEDCATFTDRMKICVTCTSTLKQDLNLLNTNWKFVERDASNMMNIISIRKANEQRVLDLLGPLVNISLPANTAYKIAQATFPEPEYQRVILTTMASQPAWNATMGNWTEWKTQGDCDTGCQKQALERDCLSDACIGPASRSTPCMGKAKEKCQPKAATCPGGWKLEFGNCYKNVQMTGEERTAILSPARAGLTVLEKQEQTLSQIARLDQICCNDAFTNRQVTHRYCKKITEPHPQMARIDFKTELVKVINKPRSSPANTNTQLVYLDLMLSNPLADEEVKCSTFLGRSNTTLDKCQTDLLASTACEINLADEDNVLYRLLPRRCTTKENKVDLDSVCQKEASMAEIRRTYGLTDGVCTKNSWSHRANSHQLVSVSAAPTGVWAVDRSGQVGVIQQDWSLTQVSGALKGRQVGVGHNLVVVLGEDGRLYERTKVGSSEPEGEEWARLGTGTDYRQIAVSSRDHLWVIGGRNNVERLGGGRILNSGGSKAMALVAVGASGVWAVDTEGAVFTCTGTYGDVETTTVDWKELEAFNFSADIMSISSGEDIVFLTTVDGRLFYRASVSQRRPEGETWVLANMESVEAGQILVRSLSSQRCDLLALDHKNRLFSAKKTCNCP